MATRKYTFAPYHDIRLREIYTKARRKDDITKGLRGMMQQYGFSRGCLDHRANFLGLRYTVRRIWKKDEDMFLLNNAGTMPVRKMARQLRRSVESLKNRMSALQLSYRLERDGFTMEEFAETIGVHNSTVSRWVHLGRIVYRDRMISHDAARDFVRDHIEELNLRLIEQSWLKETLREIIRKPRAEKKAQPQLEEIRVATADVSAPMLGIMQATADAFGINPSHMLSADNSWHIVKPRQVAMYLCRKLKGYSMTTIGKGFRKHHTTVVHSVAKVEALCLSDPKVKATVQKLESALTETPKPSTVYPWNILDEESAA